MSKNVSFQLDKRGGEKVLTRLAEPVVNKSANQIANRARSMASAISSEPPEISVTTRFGTIKRGVRAIATVQARGDDAHANYIGHVALAKSKDAGKV